uniref:Uncharacterized protein n=1 Tax=Alexandrium andersonii TaxID=327968 RepID=A0A7S2N994_9DINO
MGSACCSDSAHVSREAKQDQMLTAEEYKAAVSEDAVVLRMADAPAVKTSKACGSGGNLPPTESTTTSPPAQQQRQAEDQIVQSDADPELMGVELENLCLSATPNRDRETGREMLMSLTSKPQWKM